MKKREKNNFSITHTHTTNNHYTQKFLSRYFIKLQNPGIYV